MVVEREVGSNATGALDEQSHGGRCRSVNLEGEHGHLVFAGDPEGLTRGCEDRELARRREQRADEVRRRVQHVFAVVEHEQQTATGDGVGFWIWVSPCGAMPRVLATASGTAARLVTAPSSTIQVPSGKSGATDAAGSVASRVLPTRRRP